MKEKILNLLLEDDYVSGEKLSGFFGVSRTAVWKHIQGLKKEGYDIVALPRRGYKLVGVPDLLLPPLIKRDLNTKLIGRNIFHHASISSTNEKARDLADSNMEEGSVVVSEEQVKGRGRLGRSWNSPRGGIWFSVILRPSIAPKDSHFLTLIAGCAVSRCLQDKCGVPARIKWPNDILIGGKKVCGILTEIKAEVDRIHFLIVGIGINVNSHPEDYPVDLRDKVTSLAYYTGREWNRPELMSSLLTHFEEEYFIFLEKGPIATLERWKKDNVTVNKRVTIESGGEIYSGLALDLDERGGLLLRKDDGELSTIYSGELV